jgi:trans-AT polyketide synthase, acyltransferase and oxidoreductase domains
MRSTIVVVAPTDTETLERALARVALPFSVSLRSGRHEIETGGFSAGDPAAQLAFIPGCRLEGLGDPHFRARHGLRYACMSGAMANGIGSVEIVEAMARGGFLGVFGSAGLSLGVIEHAIDRIEEFAREPLPFGMNLIHSPGEPDLESAVVDLYLRRGITRRAA